MLGFVYTPAIHGYAGVRMTADEFLALGETQDRYELVNGVVLMAPSPSPAHWSVTRAIIVQLEHFAPSARFTYYCDIDVRFDPSTVYRPDLCLFLAGRLPPRPRRLDIAPDLIIEVLSPSSAPMDLKTKLADYARFGVQEYWVVDSRDGSLRAWTLHGNDYHERAVNAGAIASIALPGLVLDLSGIRNSAG